MWGDLDGVDVMADGTQYLEIVLGESMFFKFIKQQVKVGTVAHRIIVKLATTKTFKLNPQ